MKRFFTSFFFLVFFFFLAFFAIFLFYYFLFCSCTNVDSFNNFCRCWFCNRFRGSRIGRLNGWFWSWYGLTGFDKTTRRKRKMSTLFFKIFFKIKIAPSKKNKTKTTYQQHFLQQFLVF